MLCKRGLYSERHDHTATNSPSHPPHLLVLVLVPWCATSRVAYQDVSLTCGSIMISGPQVS